MPRVAHLLPGRAGGRAGDRAQGGLAWPYKTVTVSSSSLSSRIPYSILREVGGWGVGTRLLPASGLCGAFEPRVAFPGDESNCRDSVAARRVYISTQ